MKLILQEKWHFLSLFIVFVRMYFLCSELAISFSILLYICTNLCCGGPYGAN